jgi:predicted small secreted protein
MRMQHDQSLPPWRRGLALLLFAALLAACATPQMEGEWRDPQAAARSMQGRAVLVVCRGFDVTLERICEDRLAADAQSIGIRVLRAELPREAVADPAAGDALLKAARAVRADAVLAMRLEWYGAAMPPSGGGVGVGVGASRGGWSGGTGGAIGITLPLGGSGPTLASGTSLTDAVTGKLIWSGRARGSGAVNEPAQVGELSRVTTEALKGAGLF